MQKTLAPNVSAAAVRARQIYRFWDAKDGQARAKFIDFRV